MNERFTSVETSLNRAEFKWKALKLLEHTFILGTIFCAAALLLGSAILLGWIVSKALAGAILAFLAVVGFIAWVVIALSVLAGTPQRSWLGAALERADRRLLDRLNTLIFLERFRSDSPAASFARRIAKQTQDVLTGKFTGSPFPVRRAQAWFLAFLVALTATLIVCEIYVPWKRLVVADRTRMSGPVRPEKQLELASPATNNFEESKNWGEVRITDPGADIKVTKVDVVPLQIEASANQTLKEVGWYSTLNGDNELSHPLPPPNEPRYAAYQPTIYLDEFKLSDWDVLTYYAKANTEKQEAYASEVYFLEVRPFREDILKMPGGEGGKAYRSLNEMTSLISRQQHVIRQTHQHIQKPPEQENLQAQDRKKLSEAEDDLGDAAGHLYAEMASSMENTPIGEALDNLAKAQQSLNDASRRLLDSNGMGEAQNRERRALTELVAARKMFQKAVSEHPDAFKDSERDEQEATPIADSAKKLSKMAEFRNEAKAAGDFVRKTLEQQNALAQQAKSSAPDDFPKLAGQEQRLEKSLEEFQQQHPQGFQHAGTELQQAQQTMSQAASSLQKRNSEARRTTQKAATELQKLSDAMNGQSAGQELADAYKLKQMLDKQIALFDQASQSNGIVAETNVQQTATEARETIQQLKRVAEEEPTRDAFKPPLRDSLSGDNKVNLDAKLNRLERPRRLAQVKDGMSLPERAAEARDALAIVSKAFSESQPSALQAAQKSDSLKPNEMDSFNAGMAELESLIKQAEKHHEIPPQDSAKQRQQALYNLQTGLRSLQGDNDRGNQILLQLQEALKPDAPLEVESLKKLMDQLQHFSVETSDRLAKNRDRPQVSNIDPARLPPAYRGRIQKYFQKLSEQ